MLYDFNRFPGACLVTAGILTAVVGSDLSYIGRSKCHLEIDLFFFLSSMTAIRKFDANDVVVLAPLVSDIRNIIFVAPSFLDFFIFFSISTIVSTSRCGQCRFF